MTSPISKEPEEPQLTEIAPGVSVVGHARRILFAGNPGETDYQAAQKAVQEIRSDLSRIRHRLEMLQRIETDSAHDSQALRAAGAVHCAIVALYTLEDGERSFAAKAQHTQELWETAAEHPDDFIIEEGSSGHSPKSEWKWRDWNWSPYPTREQP